MAKSKKFPLTTIEMLIILAIIAILIALLLPPVKTYSTSARRDSFKKQMKYAALALHQYQQTHSCLPPAVTRDAEGKPIHSWRALILPFLKESIILKDRDLYYAFDEPWDSPQNQKIADLNSDLFRLDWPLKDGTTRQSKLVAIIDDSTYWNQSGENRSLLASKKTSEQILLMEIPNLKGLWNEPTDLTLNELRKLIEAGAFTSLGIYALYADGHVRWLSLEEINSPNLIQQLQMKTSVKK